MTKDILHLLRISHWSKAIFVFPGVVYSASLVYLPKAVWAALSFCFLSSAVYIYNDIHDLENDLKHPHKCKRPFTDGRVSLPMALFTLMMLLICSFISAVFISQTLVILFICYVLINLAYNHGVKKIPFLDVLCIASGFLLRVLAGTLGIGLSISWWLTLSATLLSLLVALGKRRLEKSMNLSLSARQVLEKYSFKMLDFSMLICAVLVFLTYALYTFWVRDEAFFFILSLPFAAMGMVRFIWLTRQNSGQDDPLLEFYKDRLSCINFACFFGLTWVALILS